MDVVGITYVGSNWITDMEAFGCIDITGSNNG